jgi:hypothetical protein
MSQYDDKNLIIEETCKGTVLWGRKIENILHGTLLLTHMLNGAHMIFCF